MIYDIYSSEEFSRTLKGACEVIFLDPDRDNRYVLHLQSIFISLFIIGLVILQPFLRAFRPGSELNASIRKGSKETGRGVEIRGRAGRAEQESGNGPPTKRPPTPGDRGERRSWKPNGFEEGSAGL
jgi:hypothetical protein